MTNLFELHFVIEANVFIKKYPLKKNWKPLTTNLALCFCSFPFEFFLIINTQFVDDWMFLSGRLKLAPNCDYNLDGIHL
jgi:hypothetical protein